ncbi:DnaJ domain containing protein [Trichomonas vaginalis G3]|uniref:DnaJ domain containing protein n=1 Tax=Trichomonas vaginalis (strain ATCC PRA-98 / G3) TaxID=412133 RepID=A2DRF7_TRIV3|nr:positive regulation of translation initiation in response to endoplasmic reticulum stress [Trichomonas vaginalis G3]EAY17083.1 DnaJ domain containing protein [Trichomonas vaginalis G3]KAI5517956.1 positive regulation of translation initiation in response to endoplasmic reticulum stress [Trichomonas vaginalis G3]|eukprot:XP_001329306.1 DnaJ domain containing protein [Trichomonas vaginalis G3]
MLLFFFSLLGFFNLGGFPFEDFQRFPDTPVGRVEQLMAYRKYWDAFESCNQIIREGGYVEPKVYRLKAQCALTMSLSDEAVQAASIVINDKKIRLSNNEKRLCYQIRAHANLQLGKFDQAKADAAKSNNQEMIQETSSAADVYKTFQDKIAENKNDEAARALDQLLKVALSSFELKKIRADLAWDAKDYDKFAEVAKDLPERYPDDHELLYRLGVVTMCAGDFQKAKTFFEGATRRRGYPEYFAIAKKSLNSIQRGYSEVRRNTDIKSLLRNEQKFDTIYNQTTEFCAQKSEIMRAMNLLKAKIIRSKGDSKATIDFLNEQIGTYSDTTEFQLERGEVCLDSGDYEGAIFDFQSVLRSGHRDSRAQQGLQKAQQMKKEQNNDDYYKLLEVPRDASESELKKAFRKATIKWHPDRHRGEEEKKKAEQMMKKINLAYEVLSDPQKRAMYDQGVDPDGQQMGGQGFDFNPFDLMNGFGFPGFGGFPGGAQHFEFHNGNGFHFEFHF